MATSQEGTGEQSLEAVLAEHQCSHCESSRTATMEELKRGTDDQCPIYRLLLACVKWAATSLEDYPDRPKKIIMPLDILNGALTVELEYSRQRIKFQVLRVGKSKREATTFRLNESARLLPASTSTETTFQLIRDWTEECTLNHPDCAPHVTTASATNLEDVRFLRIGADSVTLIQGIQPASYACLSHCWGSATHILRTTEETLDQHKRDGGIPLEKLPKTFRDAVQICKRMNIDFLWIDSLCIIQDSAQDWSYQASRMADVYENATITIAAAKAYNATEGCFSPIHWSYQGEVLAGYPDILIRRIPSEPGLIPKKVGLPNEPEWPIYDRGWIYQEMSLSRRVVHFGTAEVIWHCKTKLDQQSGIDFVREKSKEPFKPFKFPPPSQIQDTWYQSVKAYSQRKLTFQKDRLPAIAAIAKRIQSLEQSQHQDYLAGLWKDTLLHDLLWRAGGGPMDSVRNTSDNIPTWSWASVSGDVDWDRFEKVLECVEVLETIFITEGPSVSGTIQQASIKLRAPLLKLKDFRTLFKRDLSKEQYRDKDKAIEALQHETSADTDSNPMFEVVIKECKKDEGVYSAHTFSVPKGAFGLPLGIKNGSGDRAGGIRALVLQPTKEQDTYSRLGWCDLDIWGAIVLEHDAELKEEYNKRLVHVIEGMEEQAFTLV